MQTDNAGSENKNFYVIGLLALLVHWNWFDLVLHVLLQGHTHTLDDSTNFASNPALKKSTTSQQQHVRFANSRKRISLQACPRPVGPKRPEEALLWHLRVSS